MLAFSPFTFFLTVGIALVAVELIIFQFSTFWLFFIGAASLLAALAAFLVGGDNWIVATSVFVVSLGVLVALLYKPLKRWQQKPSELKGNSAIGQKVEVIEDIKPGEPGKALWSGTDWVAELAKGHDEPVLKGDTAEIVALEGIRLTVKPVGS